MKNLNEKKVKRWISSNIVNNINSMGEINYDNLVEETAIHFGFVALLDDDTHPVWNWAIETVEKYFAN